MRIWLRGKDWEVQPGKELLRFGIRPDKLVENHLVLPMHLSAEGFPSLWGPAHALKIRLAHSLLNLTNEEPAYRERCRQAAVDLLTVLVGQFLGLLRAEEIPLVQRGADGRESPLNSKLLRLLLETLKDEGSPLTSLVVLRDPRALGRPIAAINHPECLWFPVHSYALGRVSGGVENMLGQIAVDGLSTPSGLGENDNIERLRVVGQLRSYLRRLTRGLEAGSVLQRVLARFERGLEDLAAEGEISIRTGRAFCSTPEGLKEISLFSSGDSGPASAGCPSCGREWMNHPYPQGRLVLKGGADARRDVLCPQHGLEIDGWRDLMERSVFFDEADSTFVIWGDDRTDEGGTYLQFPPDGERIALRAGSGDSPGYARFRFNKAEIEVEGRVVRRKNVLLKSVVELPSSASAQALPVNGEEAICIDWKAGGLREDPRQRGTWTVHLRGGWRPFPWSASRRPDPLLSEPGRATLLLWPAFPLDSGWKSETVAYALRNGTGSASSAPLLRCYGEGPRQERLLGELRATDVQLEGAAGRGSLVRSQKPVQALEFRSAAQEPLGFVQPERRTFPPARVSSGTIALDFGTSNTVVAWSVRGQEPEAIELDQDAAPLEILTSHSLSEKEEAAASLSLLPFWPRRDEGRWCIPSELTFLPGSQQASLPHETLQLGQVREILRDFKWRDDRNELRPSYLKLVLQVVLANLRARGITSLELRATYPLAFGQHKLREYSQLLEQVLDQLREETGMTLALKGFADESVSGLQACEARQGNLYCVVDFGGGTADIAVQIADVEKGLIETTRRPLFVDSLRLAGNTVLDSMLADPTLVDWLLRRSNAKLNGNRVKPDDVARQIVLRDLRASPGGIPAFWTLLASSSEADRSVKQFEARNRSLFDGILGYVIRLLDHAEQRMLDLGALAEGQAADVSLFLVGQGWGLLRLQQSSRQENVQDYVAHRIQELRTALPNSQGRYRLQVFPPGRRVHGLPKLATSFGASFLSEAEIRRARDLEQVTGKETILGLNVQFFDGQKLEPSGLLSSAPRSIRSTVSSHDGWESFAGPLLSAPGVSEHVRSLFGPNDEKRRQLVETRLNDLIARHMKEALDGGESLVTTPLQLLIQEVWAQQLRRAEP